MIPEEIKKKIEQQKEAYPLLDESMRPVLSEFAEFGYSLAMEAYANSRCGMKWVVSNEIRPLKDGFYYTTDSVGNKTMVHFYNDHWHSLTGHPVVKWLDEQSPCLLEKELAAEQQRSKELVEALELWLKVINRTPAALEHYGEAISKTETALNNYKAKP